MKFSRDDADGLIAIVRQAAKQEIIPRYRRLSPDAIGTKSSESDLVTDADRGAEASIRRAVAKLMPGAAVIGEEAVAGDESLLDRIGSSDLAVIVDPVDGTWNFAKGLPLFGVIVAVVADGDTVFGLLYDPVMDDWVAAIKGQGAFFGRPDEIPQPVHVAPPESLDRLSGFVPFTNIDVPAENRQTGKSQHDLGNDSIGHDLPSTGPGRGNRLDLPDVDLLDRLVKQFCTKSDRAETVAASRIFSHRGSSSSPAGRVVDRFAPREVPDNGADRHVDSLRRAA